MSLDSHPKRHLLMQAPGLSSQADDTHWAVSACADAERGAWRRTKRLVALAGVLAQHPTAALPDACGDGARLKAASRVFANDAIAPQAWLSSPMEATYSRLPQAPVVVAVPETPDVDWTSHLATQGVGPLGHTACQGLLVHSTLAFTPEHIPLGLLAPQVGARAPDDVGQRTRRQQRPSRQQASQTWLISLEAVGHAHAGGPTTRVVRVGDREAEVYDLRAAERPEGVARLLRACGDRGVRAPERSVGAPVEAQPVGARLRVPVPRRGPHPGRAATRSLRCGPLTRCPPQPRQSEGLPAVARWAVQGREVEPPEGVEPLAWRLWTTVAVPTVEDAIARVAWYACRWGLEGWPRLLTSGGRLEARQWATGARVQRCLTRSRVSAWRVFDATPLARAGPEMPCSVLWESEEGQARYGAIHHGATPPERPPAGGQAVPWSAPLGGWVGRRRRDQPGAETWWRGFHPLTDCTRRYRMMRSAPP